MFYAIPTIAEIFGRFGEFCVPGIKNSGSEDLISACIAGKQTSDTNIVNHTPRSCGHI